MKDYSEVKKAAENAIGPGADGSDLNAFAAYAEEVLYLIADNALNAKNSSEWEAASLHWMSERDRLHLALTTISECATDALK